MAIVAGSILAANFENLAHDLSQAKQAGVDWVHFDVMDGHFVPNISFGPMILEACQKTSDLFMDVHLMVTNPKEVSLMFLKHKPDLIVFHQEALSDEEIYELIALIKSHGCKAGISIKPNTSVAKVKQFLDIIDLVLVMSVEPGFGGQSFKDSALAKIALLNDIRNTRCFDYLIQVDGGINEQTGRQCIEAGCDVLVAGSYVFNAKDMHVSVQSLK